MENEQTLLARQIDSAGDQAEYDSQVKNLLANKAILAWILKTCTEEFAQYTPEEIMPCIEGDPEISRKAVHAVDLDSDQREKLLPGDSKVEGRNTEDNNGKDQTVYYDIRLNACTRDETPISLIINIEAQRNSSPGYPIERRAIYYCGRLISAQYGTVFSHSEYGKIRKVYSIWICSEPSAEKKNTIQRVFLDSEAVFGNINLEKENIDLMQVLIVNLGDPDSPINNQILRLLNVLLSDKTDTNAKKRVLEDEYHIAMSRELESEVSRLCDLSQGIFEKGVSQGFNQGIIVGTVETLREDGKDDKVIVERIMRKYHLTRAEAEAYVLETCAV